MCSLLVIVLVLPFSLHRGGGNPIQIPHPTLRNPPPALETASAFLVIIDLLYHAYLLQRLQYLSVHRSTGVDMM